GAPALAGVSLVYPLVMLMQTMSAGGMGGGVASAVARALGAGRRAEAQALAAHAVVIALVMASIFTTGLLLGGPAIYRAIGGTGEALEAAVTYSRVVFGGVVVLVLLVYLCSPMSPVRLSFRGLRFRRAHFWESLRVGAPGSLNTILTNLTVVLMTGLVGPFG